MDSLHSFHPPSRTATTTSLGRRGDSRCAPGPVHSPPLPRNIVHIGYDLSFQLQQLCVANSPASSTCLFDPRIFHGLGARAPVRIPLATLSSTLAKVQISTLKARQNTAASSRVLSLGCESYSAYLSQHGNAVGWGGCVVIMVVAKTTTTNDQL